MSLHPLHGVLAKGDRTKYIREALQELGLETDREPVQKWILKKYGKEASVTGESTFYNTRRAMQQNRLTPVAQDKVTRPSIATLVDEQRADRIRPSVHVVGQSPPVEKNGVVSLVKQLKEIVAKLGKEEVKELIDIL